MRQALKTEQEGIIDEIGVLVLHAGYAGRFFPGTSVLHTRPRYLFFTCWNYLWMRDQGVLNGRPAVRLKKEAERWVTARLKAHDPEPRGVIGGEIFPSAPVQAPDFIYWTALRKFGFYRGVSRAGLLGRWDPERVHHVTHRSGGEEEEGLRRELLAEFHVPSLPSDWRKRKTGPIDFGLSRIEAEFLRTRLVALGADCLLGRAAASVERRAPTGEYLWDDPLIEMAARACDETARIERAKLASSLARVLRATYGALVEKVDREDAAKFKPSSNRPRPYYERLVSFWTEPERRVDVRAALRLNLDLLRSDIPKVSGNRAFSDLLTHVQGRLRRIDGPRALAPNLLDAATEEWFRTVECQRKGRRARLPRTPEGRERRRDFGPETVKDEGLGYRWRQVRTLLRDLRAGLRDRSNG